MNMEEAEAKSLTEVCCKISYRGVQQIVRCVGVHYNEMLDLLIERFALPPECKEALRISNGSGYTFDKELFEYFIMLFPKPQITFYLRLEPSEIPPNSVGLSRVSTRKPFAWSGGRHNNNQDCDEDDESAVTAVPVYRQNCFIGQLPAHNVRMVVANHQNEYSKQTTKRIRADGVTRKYRPKTMTRSRLKRPTIRV